MPLQRATRSKQRNMPRRMGFRKFTLERPDIKVRTSRGLYCILFLVDLNYCLDLLEDPEIDVIYNPVRTHTLTLLYI